MDSVNDRMRLKDRILANVAKGVKAVQELAICSDDGSVTLGNTDWQCHKLCEHIDHALLHGLRHVTHGYWKMVSDFTTKEAVKEIKRLQNVTTDLGRGRAWLFMALNENLLESYIRCYQQNEKLVKKHYVRDALVLDQQRWNVLLTLTSGLENAIFQLEYDMPYLDLSVYPPKSRHYSDSLAEDDRVSICSMESIAPAHSRPLAPSVVSNPDFSRGATDSDSASVASGDTSNSSQRRYSPSVDSGCHDDWNAARQRSITPVDSATDLEQDSRMRRLDSLASLEENTADSVDNDFEVIRVIKKTKSHKGKKTKKHKKGHPKSSKAVIGDIAENQSDPTLEQTMESPRGLSPQGESADNLLDSLTSSTDTSWTSETLSPGDGVDNADDRAERGACSKSSLKDKSSVSESSNRDSGVFTEQFKGRELSSGDSRDVAVTDSNLCDIYNTDSVYTDAVEESKPNFVQYDFKLAGEAEIDVTDSGVCNTSTHSPPDTYSRRSKLARDASFAESYKNILLANGKPERGRSPFSGLEEDFDSRLNLENNEQTDNTVESSKPMQLTNHDPEADEVANQTSAMSQLEGRVEDMISKGNQYHRFVEEDEEEVVDFKDVVEERDRSRSLCAGEVELDNNSMLFLMLDILDSDEVFIKMFSCRQGHTEGETKIVFLLIASNSLYILSQRDTNLRFTKDFVVPFIDIDYVSVGLQHQLVHVACKNKRHQYWFTTGEERTTIGIVDCLAASVEKCELDLGQLEVDTGATAQKIALRKYVTKECQCEASEAEIVCYSLVHWEDPSSKFGASEYDREGHLLYKSIETTGFLGGQSWKSAYAVLRDCTLCLYQDKKDSKPLHFLQMGGDQCVGCKRDFNSDRSHTIKVMLADGSSWSLALASEIEANSWLQGLCQAMSQALHMSPARTTCTPCCLILTKQKLLMCHEDLQTSFVRTLGSANLLDVTAILTDDTNRLFYVLAFDSQEAHVTSEKWVLYFNSEYEGNRFIQALSGCWATLYQVEVPLLPIDDFALQKKCNEMSEFLVSSLTLKS